MNRKKRITSVLVILLLFASAITLLACTSGDKAESKNKDMASAASVKPSDALPRLQNFKSPTCPPCRAMEPILEELSVEYAGKFIMEIVDVSLQENRSLAIQHSIQYIPTQIFYDADGKQLFRHTGFYSRQDILNKWKELGYDMSPQ